LAQVIVVPTATVMSESANPTILDASTAGGRGWESQLALAPVRA
jgi:hypothetical protein